MKIQNFQTGGLIRLDDVGSSNVALVTVTGPGVTITSIQLNDLAVGDFILVTGFAILSKGVASGDTIIAVRHNGGTGAVRFGDNKTSVNQREQGAVAGNDASLAIGAVGRVTSAGSPIIDLFGSSQGSDSTVAIGNGNLHLISLRPI